MARPPRSVWVHKKWHKYVNLPRPKLGRVEPFDYEEMDATPERFEYKLDGEPPKLWVAWLFRSPYESPSEVKTDLRRLFGEKWSSQTQKMKIFKNTPYWNSILWRVKQYIEIRPITFPHGEPTETDINYTTILSNGECIVNKNMRIDEKQLIESPEEDSKNFPPGYITSKLTGHFQAGKQVQEDEVWGNQDHSRW